MQRHHFAHIGPYTQSYGFSNSRLWTWELDPKDGWSPKIWCFRTVVLEKTLESPLDSKEIKQVNTKGNQPWILNGRTDAEAEAPILWSPDVKRQLIGKDPDAGKNRRQEMGTTEDKMVGWHYHQWTQWIWASSGRWWWTEKPGVLQSMGSKRIRHDWVTELNWTEYN